MFKKDTDKVEIIMERTAHPVVILSINAVRKMKGFVDGTDKEIGWLGTVDYKEEQNLYIIDDVILFKQEVSSVTTDLDEKDMASFANETIKELGVDKGSEMLNRVKLWGHSHVNMDITPSGTDDKQMVMFQDTGTDFFIRIIANKKDKMKVDIYDYKKGIIYLNIDYYVQYSVREEEIKSKIRELEAELSTISEKEIEDINKIIEEEIKDKLVTKSYTTKSTGGKVVQQSFGNYERDYDNAYTRQYYGDYGIDDTVEEILNDPQIGIYIRDEIVSAQYPYEVRRILKQWGYNETSYTIDEIEELMQLSKDLLVVEGKEVII